MNEGVKRITLDWFAGKTVVVMGLGLNKGGVGSTIWLMRHGAKVTVTDLRDQHVLAPSIAEVEKEYITGQKELGRGKMHRVKYVLGRHDEADFASADMVIQNPGVPRESQFLKVAREHGVMIENDVSIFFQLCPFPILAITGTRGKTTTTTLVGAMAKMHDRRSVMGGNIRIPVLSLLDSLMSKKVSAKSTKPLVVLELSSWQLEALEPHHMSPQVGVVTNLFPDHLNRYRDMADYAAAKENIIQWQTPADVAVLNAENEWTVKMGERARGRIIWFGKKLSAKMGDGVFVADGWIMMRAGGKVTKVVKVSALKVMGEHNVMNVMSAVAAGVAAGVTMTIIKKAIAEFRGVEDRQELIATIKGVDYVNDTTATSPDACVVALKTFGAVAKKKRIVLISGGADKKLEFGEWAETVKKYVKYLVLFDGTATPRMEEALAKVKWSTPMIGARSMQEALLLARDAAEKGDVVLLSLGCASFGLFLNEFDRGGQFVKGVKGLLRGARND
jgi:UDP-N-acetylmuramoylalanine--D-glutamate ligase